MAEPKITLLPTIAAGARAVLGKAMEDVQEGEVVFVVRMLGDAAHVTSTSFSTRDLCWAAQVLNFHALDQVAKSS